MDLEKKNLLMTGLPGVGKTTLIRRLYEALKRFQPVGFYTTEIRKDGIREGFELVDLRGTRRVLSHVAIKSPFRVGRYNVDVGGFEEFLDGISFFDPLSDMIMIDEIGKMECLSSRFNKIVKEAFDSKKCVIATIALKGGGLIAEVKQRQDAKLFELTLRNRDVFLSEILREINP